MKSQNNQVAIDLLATIAKNANQIEVTKAYTTFCNLFRNRIYKICLSNSNRSVPGYMEEADEICNDTLLKILKVAHQYNPEKAAVFTWLSIIIRNEYISRYRKQKERIKFITLEVLESEFLFNNDESTEIGNDQENVSSSVADKMILELKLLRKILNSLPASWKDIILMTMKYAPLDLPIEERERIAKEYGIKEKTIDTYRGRAKKAIEKAFGRPINWDYFKVLAKSE